MQQNVIFNRFIKVLKLNGSNAIMSPWEVLTKANQVYCIAESNPMDSISIFRFLVALLIWCKPDISEDDLKELEGFTGIPPDWLVKLGTPENPNPAFDLFDDDSRFYQTKPMKTEQSLITYLFPYIPTKTNIAHFCHSIDNNTGLCVSCCIVGLLRTSACITSGGSGYSPSINGTPPLMIIAQESNLLKTLGKYSIDIKDTKKGFPIWEVKGIASKEVGLLEGLTWQPREIWLDYPKEGVDYCNRCGSLARLIYNTHFKPGRSSSLEDRKWCDPFVIYIGNNARSTLTGDLPKSERALKEIKSTNRDLLKRKNEKDEYAKKIQKFEKSLNYLDFTWQHILLHYEKLFNDKSLSYIKNSYELLFAYLPTTDNAKVYCDLFLHLDLNIGTLSERQKQLLVNEIEKNRLDPMRELFFDSFLLDSMKPKTLSLYSTLLADAQKKLQKSFINLIAQMKSSAGEEDNSRILRSHNLISRKIFSVVYKEIAAHTSSNPLDEKQLKEHFSRKINFHFTTKEN